MKEMLIILFTAILVENYVLMKFLAICSFLGVSKKLDAAIGMSAAVIFVMLMATAATWPIYHYILDPLKLGYMQTVIFILVIAALVQLVEMILKKFMPPLYRSLGVFLPLITTNCAILGVVVLNITKTYTFSQSMVNSLGAGLGYLLAMVLFSGIRSRVDTADVPECFKGVPITLVAASIMSVSFMGFTGLVENMFK